MEGSKGLIKFNPLSIVNCLSLDVVKDEIQCLEDPNINLMGAFNELL